MSVEKKVLIGVILATFTLTSGCDLTMAQEEVVSAETGAIAVVPAGPPRPSQPRDEGRGGGGGGWGG